MRKTPDCYPCVIKQVQRVLDVAFTHPCSPVLSNTEKKELIQSLELTAKASLEDLPEDITPAEMAYGVIKLAYNAVGIEDPYELIKSHSNQEAMRFFPVLRERIQNSSDPLQTAAQIAAAGNIIDLGIELDIDIQESIEKILKEGFAINHLDQMVSDLKAKESTGVSPEVLYICDNAGEIAFDRLFLETLSEHFPNTRFVVAVNQGPILNDATRKDAEEVGLTDLFPVIDNGYDQLGTVLHAVSPEFLAFFNRADWIVSKGQANYETLDGVSDRIVFLLKAKCEAIASHIGISYFQGVFKRNTVCQDRFNPQEEMACLKPSW